MNRPQIIRYNFPQKIECLNSVVPFRTIFNEPSNFLAGFKSGILCGGQDDCDEIKDYCMP
jgi:hypothetical protein